MKHKLLLFLAVLSITGCSLQELRQDGRPAASRAFGVEEAKEFFEKDYMGLLTRSQDSGRQRKSFKGKLHPGDFTPLWDKAVYSESDGVAAYDVDILADRSIVAIRSKFGPSGAKAERLKVYQKLVVRRNVQSGKMASYVLSLIPDVGCDDRRLPDRFSSRGKDKGGFSGIAVYTTTDRGALVRVQEYKNGVLQRGVYIPSGKGSYADRCRMAREILDGTALMSRKNIMTRSGEDVWEDSWDDNDYSDLDINDLEDLGEGVYTDGNGHYYIDIDYDGDIDLETIAPGHVEEEMPEEPETPTPDPGGGNEGDGNEGDDTGGDEVFPDDDTPSGDDYPTLEQIINSKKDALIISMGSALGSVKVGLTVVIGTPNGSPFASCEFTLGDLWNKLRNYTIIISGNLNDIQQDLVLAHEFMHLKLLQISQDAGSSRELALSDLELLTALNLYGVNDGHHFYMGQHVKEMEQLLREAFPGMDDDFYEYGKWGGGAFNSDKFDQLSKEEQDAIEEYLRGIGLLL